MFVYFCLIWCLIRTVSVVLNFLVRDKAAQLLVRKFLVINNRTKFVWVNCRWVKWSKEVLADGILVSIEGRIVNTSWNGFFNHYWFDTGMYNVTTGWCWCRYFTHFHHGISEILVNKRYFLMFQSLLQKSLLETYLLIKTSPLAGDCIILFCSYRCIHLISSKVV